MAIWSAEEIRKMLVEPEKVQGRRGGFRDVMDVPADLIKNLKAVLASRKGKPFAVPMKMVKEQVKYKGTAKSVAAVIGALNKRIRAEGVNAYKHGDYVGFETCEPTVAPVMEED